MKVDIIIVNYNAGILLQKCVHSVLNTKDVDFKVTIIDNSSTDSSHTNCKEKFPSITLIENKTNLGYCEANNIGIRQSKADFIVLLNPDTEVEPDWLEKLYRAYQKNGKGLYQPKILYAFDKKTIYTTGNVLSLFGLPHHRGVNLKDTDQYNKFEKIGYASGACLFTSRKTLDEIGYLDPYLFVYYDDSGLAWRAAHLGIHSYYVPDSVIYHWEGQSFKKIPKKRFYLLQRNRWYCLLTLYSRSTLFRILPSLILFEIFSLFYYLTKGMASGKILAYRDIIKDRKLIYKKYLELESKKKVSDKEIISNFLNFLKLSKESGTIRNVDRFAGYLEKFSMLFL